MIELFHQLLSLLNYSVSIHSPGTLLVLFAVGAVSDIGIPLFFGLEAFLFFASYSVGPLSSQVGLIVVMLLAGRECGAGILYWLSAMVGNPLINWIRRRFPTLFRNLVDTKARLSKQTALAVALVRLTPGLLQVPSLVSGIMRLPVLRFFAGVAISSLLYDLAFIVLGFLSRIGLAGVSENTKLYLMVGFIAVMAVVAFLFGLRRSLKRQ